MSCNIFESIIKGDYENVVNCIALNAEIDEPYWDGNGKPPILLSVENGHIDITRLLCSHNCNINARTIHGETALHLAISKKKNIHEMLDLLLTYGCDANIQENQGQTPLHYMIKNIIKNNNYSDKNLECIQKLINSSKPNITDNRQRTALHKAVYGRAKLNFIQILLSCDPNVQNNRGETPLLEALETDSDIETIKLLIQHTDLSLQNIYGETALHISSRKRRCDIMEYLITKNAPINAKDIMGNTALHLVAERGYSDALNILLCKNVEINAQNLEGLTPLHVAVQSGFQSVVELLLKAEKCDVNVQTMEAETALDLAQYRRRSQPELSNMIFTEIKKRLSDKII